ncbi:enoyl-CoA hydratase/isomerase family protein, partial [Escherichia coli]|nr:enoyl-CoA hydratase/isomerase family protein [Escherichia coli]
MSATAAAATTAPNAPAVLRRDEGAVAILTLNRPASRNALSRAMLAALRAELDAIAAEEGIRCVVLT